MRGLTVSSLFVIVLVFTATPAHASPIGIEVISTAYSASIELTLSSGVTTTTTAAGTDPVSLSLEYIYSFESTYDYAAASVSADWLTVSVGSRSVNSPVIIASANSEVTFSPHTDGIATIGFDRLDGGPYTDGFVSLFDLTGDREVWRYWWEGQGTAVTYPEAGIDWGLSIRPNPVELPTTFSAANTYRLHLFGRTDSQGDSTDVSVQVSGLVAVPDPGSTLFLLGIGLVGLRAARKRWQ
jgi:hypothetical protein